MGRSVMTLSGAEAITYLEFGPDECWYRELWEDDIKDGLVEPEDDFEEYMYRLWDDHDSDGEWDDLIGCIQDRLSEFFPSLEPVTDLEWIGNEIELRVIARNAHSVVTISLYNGLVALCLGADYDRREFFADPTDLAGIGHAWRSQVAEKFSILGTLSKIGTFSDGTSVYSEAGK